MWRTPMAPFGHMTSLISSRCIMSSGLHAVFDRARAGRDTLNSMNSGTHLSGVPRFRCTCTPELQCARMLGSPIDSTCDSTVHKTQRRREWECAAHGFEGRSDNGQSRTCDLTRAIDAECRVRQPSIRRTASVASTAKRRPWPQSASMKHSSWQCESIAQLSTRVAAAR